MMLLVMTVLTCVGWLVMLMLGIATVMVIAILTMMLPDYDVGVGEHGVGMVPIALTLRVVM